jgi:nicotinate-nucleotide adenylyltransferase
VTIAVLGGVFDPPHLGHLALAEGALEHLWPTQLLVLVNERPGHKSTVLDAATRLRLAKIAFRALPRTDVRPDDSAYTVDMLRDENFAPDDVFVIGADEWAVFDTWKEPEEILRLIRVAVAERPGVPPPVIPEDLRDRVIVFPIEQQPVSAREIRARVADGEPIDGLVPPAVAEAIESQGLYR